MNNRVALKGGICLVDDEFIKKDLYISSERISFEPVAHTHVVDCRGLVIAPGFIDLQINGIAGVDFTSHPDKIAETTEAISSTGTTSFLATIISSDTSAYFDIADKLSIDSKKGARCLGVHLEGPLLNPARKGAHQLSNVHDPIPLDVYIQIIESLPVQIITLAPEIQGALDLISYCKAKNIACACGHSEASCQILQEAKSRGLIAMTHLFNAMSPLHQRNPGPIGYTLATKSLYYSLIADLFHVDPYIIRLAFNAHAEGLFLVSDCNALCNSFLTKARLGNNDIELIEHKAVVSGTSNLAGSVTSLNVGLKNLMQIVGKSFEEVCRAVTTIPAKILQKEHSIGAIKPGYYADLVLFNENELNAVDPIQVYVAGNLVFERKR